MDLKVSPLVVDQQPTEILKGTSIAVHVLVLAGHQEVRQVEILLEVEGDVDSSNRKEKARTVLLHHLHQRTVATGEPQNQLQR